MKIVKGAKIKGNLSNDLYILDGSTLVGSTTISSYNDWRLTKIRHAWLGHVSERGLKELHKQELLGNHLIGTLEICEHCIYGKSTRVSYRTTSFKEYLWEEQGIFCRWSFEKDMDLST